MNNLVEMKGASRTADGLPERLAAPHQVDMDWMECCNPGMRKRNREEIAARTAPNGCASDTLELALGRYFQLLTAGRMTLTNRFSEEQLMMLLDSNPSERWTMPNSLANAFADLLGNAQPSPNSLEGELHALLSELTPLEELALVDAAERFWCSHVGQARTATEIAASIGLAVTPSPREK